RAILSDVRIKPRQPIGRNAHLSQKRQPPVAGGLPDHALFFPASGREGGRPHASNGESPPPRPEDPLIPVRQPPQLHPQRVASLEPAKSPTFGVDPLQETADDQQMLVR